jgi:hypothetical protein
MELEELLDWYIGPQLRSVPGVVETNSFGGENKPVPDRAPPRAPAGAAPVHRRGRRGARAVQRQRRRRLHRAQPGAARDRLRTASCAAARTSSASCSAPRRRACRSPSRRSARCASGPKLRRGAATQDGEGEVVVGVALMLMGENSRTVTQGIKDKLAERWSRRCPRACASSPSTIEPGSSIARSHGRHQPARGRRARRPGPAPGPGGPARRARGGDDDPAVDAVRRDRHERDRPLGQPDEPGRDRLRAHRRRLGDRRRERGAAPVRGERVALAADLPATSARRSSRTRRWRCAARAVFGEIIIAIVYLPILSLTGMEGKLFHPMAFDRAAGARGAFICLADGGPGADELLREAPPGRRARRC